MMEAYQERFLKEIDDLKDKIDKLTVIVENYEELDFTPTCPLWLLYAQLNAMCEYYNILLERKRIEIKEDK